jgi:hypothetical protein
VNIYKELVQKVSSSYKDRVVEVVSVLDSSLEYSVQKVRSVAQMRDKVKSLLEDSNGYRFVDGSITVLSGNVIVYPHIRISGDLVIILVKNRTLGVSEGDIRKANVILVYEKSESLAEKLGGFVNC